MTGFTPGPYKYDKDNNTIYAGPEDIIVVYEGGLQFKSDGPLLAAAPEMYEALKEAAMLVPIGDGILTKIEDALSKAEGET